MKKCRCGQDNEDSAVFCMKCGSHFQAGPKGRGLSAGAVAAIVGAVIVMIIIVIVMASSDLPGPATLSDMAKLETAPISPNNSGQLTRFAPVDHGRYIPCYALLTNPYVGRGELVTLDLTVVEISSGNTDNMTLSKMISEDVALFNVEQFGVGTGGIQGIPIGQIAVVVDSSKSIPSTSEAHYWKIEPMGTMEGTNGLGAATQVPLVRFVRYLTKVEANETWNKVSTNYASHGYNVDFGDGRDLLPTQPVGPSENVGLFVTCFKLLKNPYFHKGEKAVLEIAPNPGNRWMRVQFDRMISESLALYTVQDVPQPGWYPNTFRDVGQLAVEIASPENIPRTTESWSVELLGVAEATNGFGAALQIPLVKFNDYAKWRPPCAKDRGEEPRSGETWQLTSMYADIAVSADVYEQWEDSTEARENLKREGKVFEPEMYSRVEILQSRLRESHGDTIYQVRVLDGPKKGMTGWVSLTSVDMCEDR